MKGIVEQVEQLTGTLGESDGLSGSLFSPTTIGGKMEYGTVKVVSSDYDELKNKPTINEVELVGNVTSEDIGVLDVDDEMTIKLINDTWDAIFN